MVGSDGATVFQDIMQNASRPSGLTAATVIGIATLLFGASGVFGALQDAMNTVWGVAPKPGRGLWGMIESRFLSFTMVLGLGFLLLVSLVVSAGLTALGEFVSSYFQEYVIIGQILNFLISFGFVTLLFAMIFKVLPDVEIAWSDVWMGAVVTALLFTIGKFVIGLYLGQQSFGSTYGAAGSILIVLLWIYYSAQILLMGAEFTQVYARRFGSRIVPDKDAVPLDEEMRAKQGIPKTEQLEEAARQQEEVTQPSQVETRQQPAKRTPAPVPQLSQRQVMPVTADKPYTPFSIMWLIVLFTGLFVGAFRKREG
jgi:membrane protein